MGHERSRSVWHMESGQEPAEERFQKTGFPKPKFANAGDHSQQHLPRKSLKRESVPNHKVCIRFYTLTLCRVSLPTTSLSPFILSQCASSVGPESGPIAECLVTWQLLIMR